MKRTLQAALKDRPFAVLVALFILLSLSDLTLSLAGMYVRGFTANPLFQLLAARGVVVGSLIWLGVTLVVSANMVIAYPAAPVWARREALPSGALIAILFASDTWTIFAPLTR